MRPLCSSRLPLAMVCSRAHSSPTPSARSIIVGSGWPDRVTAAIDARA
jgi:hypothetical protein